MITFIVIAVLVILLVLSFGVYVNSRGKKTTSSKIKNDDLTPGVHIQRPPERQNVRKDNSPNQVETMQPMVSDNPIVQETSADDGDSTPEVQRLQPTVGICPKQREKQHAARETKRVGFCGQGPENAGEHERRCETTSHAFLSNIGQSCYMDSALVALFSDQSGFVEKMLNTPYDQESAEIARVRNTLIDYRNSYWRLGSKQKSVCTDLRSAIQGIKGKDNLFLNGWQEDPVVFIEEILIFLPMRNVAMVEESDTFWENNVNQGNSMVSDTKHRAGDSIVLRIYNPKYWKFDPSTITSEETEFLDSPHRGKYRINVRKTHYTTALEYLIIHINRTEFLKNNQNAKDDGNYNQDYVFEIPEMCRNLILHAIVLFKNRHYVCFFREDGVWYYYDDLYPECVSRLGSFQEMLDNKYLNPKTHGVLYFYSLPKLGEQIG